MSRSKKSMYRTFHIAVDFLIVLYKGLYGWGGGGDPAGHSKLTSSQMALALLIATSGPKKAWIFRAHPFQWPSKMDFPSSKSLRPAPCIRLRYVPTFSKPCTVARPQLAFHARFNSTVAIKDVHHLWNGSI